MLGQMATVIRSELDGMRRTHTDVGRGGFRVVAAWFELLAMAEMRFGELATIPDRDVPPALQRSAHHTVP